MLTRRTLLGLLASLPFAGFIKPTEAFAGISEDQIIIPFGEPHDDPLVFIHGTRDGVAERWVATLEEGLYCCDVPSGDVVIHGVYCDNEPHSAHAFCVRQI